MLTLSLPEDVEVQLEHSLVSVSKWEQIYQTPFYGRKESTHEEILSYFDQMLLSPAPSVNWTEQLAPEHFTELHDYINSSHTATTFRDDPTAKATQEIITNELIYSWMIRFKIPFDPCENWHLNRLMTLIKIRGIQETPAKKMTRAQQAAEYRRLNEQRRQQLGTSG